MRLFDKPFKDQPHAVGDGVQKIYKFPNGYGASVVRFKTRDLGFIDTMRNGYGSYTRNENEWELAVLKFDGEESHLTYDTPITDDVMGYLTEDQVEEILQSIRAL